MPEFSIILPVGNGAGFSSRAVGSILSQRVDAEILWVSEFNPKELGVESKTVQWLFQKNTGIAEARNLGLENASGNWLGFLDADDCYTPNALNSLKENLSQNMDCDMVYGSTQYDFLQPEWRDIYRPGPFDRVTSPILGATLWKTTFAKKVGLFDVEFKTGEDVDWMNRAKEMGLRVNALEQVVLLKTIHGQNLTLNAEQINRDLVNVARKSINRKRMKQ